MDRQALLRHLPPLLLLAGWAALAGSFAARLHGRSLDDFFITYRYADNLASGRGFVFNPGERVFGLTAPGFGLLLAAARRLTALAVADLGTVSTGLALVALAALLLLESLREATERERATEGALGGTLLLGSTAIWACHGAEGPVVLALLIAAASLARRFPVTAGLLAGFAVWCRPDAGLGALLLAVLLFAEDRRPPWRYALAVAGTVLAGALAAYLYFGAVLPNSYGAKQATAGWLSSPDAGWLAWWRPAVPLLRRHTGGVLPVLLLGLAGQPFLLAGAGRGGRLLSLHALALAAVYPFLGVAFSAWYAIPQMAALLYGIAWLAGGIARLLTRLVHLPRLAPPVAALLLLPLVLRAWPREREWLAGTALPGHYEGYRSAGAWIGENSRPDQGIACAEVGTLAYYSDRPVEDLMGLVTPRSLPFVARRDMEGAFLAKPTEFLVVRPAIEGILGPILAAPWFPRSFHEVARFGPADGDWTVIYERRRRPNRLPPPRPPAG